MSGSVSAMSSAIIEAVARQRDRRLRRSASVNLPGAVFVQRQREARDRAGHADAERGVARLRRYRACRRRRENIARGRGRRGLAIVDGDVLVALGRMDHHETAAADIAGARIGHGQRKTGGDRGIDRIAALSQDIGADPRGDLFLAPPPCRVRRKRREPVSSVRRRVERGAAPGACAQALQQSTSTMTANMPRQFS